MTEEPVLRLPDGAVITVDTAELACRVLEAVCELRRPPGTTPRESLENLPPMIRVVVLRGLKAALEYLLEQSGNTHGETLH